MEMTKGIYGHGDAHTTDILSHVKSTVTNIKFSSMVMVPTMFNI